MQLKQIISDYPIIKSYHFVDREIEDIVFDSRKAKENHMFFAIKGSNVDGHQYIEQVLDKKSIVIVGENFSQQLIDNHPNVVFLEVLESSHFLGFAAHKFYGEPSKKLKLVGITGTNGKTTIATLLHQLFLDLGYYTGLLSTIENKIGKETYPATHTTPDAINLNKMLKIMVDKGVSHCFMEVSSHAIDQNRIAGLAFNGGVFSNITQDHLDYHHDFKNYILAKKKFFDNLSKDSFSLANADDRNGKIMLQNTKSNKHFYALKSHADFKGKIIENSLDGLHLEMNNSDVWFNLSGSFNAYNLLAIYGVATLLGEESREVLTKMSLLKSAEGRFEVIRSDNGKTVIVDYAHTPDALKNVLDTLTQCKKANQKIITVVGAGGNRDKTKRPIMGKLVAQKSDRVILTSDNPRDEEPEQIVEDVKKGVENKDLEKILAIINRKEAIRTAYALAGNNDIILIAGKGHEKYQEIKGVKTHFDDKEIVLNLFNKI